MSEPSAKPVTDFFTELVEDPERLSTWLARPEAVLQGSSLPTETQETILRATQTQDYGAVMALIDGEAGPGVIILKVISPCPG